MWRGMGVTPWLPFPHRLRLRLFLPLHTPRMPCPCSADRHLPCHPPQLMWITVERTGMTRLPHRLQWRTCRLLSRQRRMRTLLLIHRISRSTGSNLTCNPNHLHRSIPMRIHSSCIRRISTRRLRTIHSSIHRMSRRSILSNIRPTARHTTTRRIHPTRTHIRCSTDKHTRRPSTRNPIRHIPRIRRSLHSHTRMTPPLTQPPQPTPLPLQSLQLLLRPPSSYRLPPSSRAQVELHLLRLRLLQPAHPL